MVISEDSVKIEVELQDIDNEMIDEIMEELVCDLIDEIVDRCENKNSTAHEEIIIPPLRLYSSKPDKIEENDDKYIISYLLTSDQAKFMRKTYALLSVQFGSLITFTGLGINYSGYRSFIKEQGIIYLFSIIVPIIIVLFSYFKGSKFDKNYKLNIPLFSLFTVFSSYAFSLSSITDNPYMYMSTFVTIFVYYIINYIYTFSEKSIPTSSTNMIGYLSLSLFTTPAFLVISGGGSSLVDFMLSMVLGLIFVMFIQGSNFIISQENTNKVSVFSYTLSLYSTLLTILYKIYEEAGDVLEAINPLKCLK